MRVVSFSETSFPFFFGPTIHSELTNKRNVLFHKTRFIANNREIFIYNYYQTEKPIPTKIYLIAL